MEIWTAQTTLIRLMAVIFVLALTHRESGRGRSALVLYALLFFLFNAARLLRGGPADLVTSVAGAAVAAALAVPFALRGRLSRHELAAAAVAGAILGPAGTVTAICIAAVFCWIARFDCGGGAFNDRFAWPAPNEVGTGPEPPAATQRGRPGHSGEQNRHDSPATASKACAQAIPVRLQFAAATLAVLLSDACM